MELEKYNLRFPKIGKNLHKGLPEVPRYFYLKNGEERILLRTP